MKYYYRKCKLCNETQKLKAEPRSENCKHCRMSKLGARTGTGNPNGHIDSAGYRVLMIDKVPTLEHRHVMQTFLGRKLGTKEHVHHLDGNRLNNIIENLQLLSASDHAKEHFTSEVAKKNSLLGHAVRWQKKVK